MSGPAYVQEPTVQYLHQVLEELARGYLKIPRFQRGFVWRDEQRLELLRSIQAGIPIGSLLVWRTELASLRSITTIGPHRLPEKTAAVGLHSYLLDGMQRVSTLYGCLRELPAGADPSFETEDGEETSWRVAYELRSKEFEILKTGDLQKITHLLLPLLLDSVKLLRFQRGLTAEPDADQLIQQSDALAETFRTYKIPLVPLVTDELATATRTFERINRQGTPMSELHMVRALTWTTSFDLVEELEALSEQLHHEERWGEIEPEWILKVCKAIAGIDFDVENPEETAMALQEAGPQTLLAACKEALLRAISWLRDSAGVPGLEVLPYAMQLVMVAAALHKNPLQRRGMGVLFRLRQEQASRQLHAWFWETTYTERFSGITGYQTRAMLDGMYQLVNGQAWSPKGKKKAPNFKLPTKLNSSWARNRTAAIRLAALGPLDLEGKKIDAAKQLAEQGVAALVPLSLSTKTLAGRFLLRDHPELLGRLQQDVTSVPTNVLASHAVDEEAVAALAEGDFAAFEQARARTIAHLEEAFYRETQEGNELEEVE